MFCHVKTTNLYVGLEFLYVRETQRFLQFQLCIIDFKNVFISINRLSLIPPKTNQI